MHSELPQSRNIRDFRGQSLQTQSNQSYAAQGLKVKELSCVNKKMFTPVYLCAVDRARSRCSERNYRVTTCTVEII